MKKSKIKLAFISGVFAVFGGFIIFNNFIVHGASASIVRETEYRIEVNTNAPEKSTVRVYRKVQVKSYQLVLLKDNYEYVNVCPASGQISDLNYIKKNVKVIDSLSHKKLPFSIQVTGNCLLVKVPYKKELHVGDTFKFQVVYNDKTVAINNGGVIEVSYPRLKDKPNLVTTQKLKDTYFATLHNIYITLVFDKNLYSQLHTYIAGNPIHPASNRVWFDNHHVYIKYNLLDIWQTGLYFVIGNIRTVKFHLRIFGEKESSVLNVVDSLVGFKQVIIPRADKVTGQTVYYESVTPAPLSVKLNKYGNLVATFKGGMDVDVIGYAEIFYRPVNLGQLSQIKLKDYHVPELLKNYVLPSHPYWPSDNPQIRQIANNLKASTVMQTLINDVNYILDHIQYNETTNIASLSRKGALQALHDGNGVCMEFADTLISILRAQGIASRAVLGNVLNRFVDPTYRNIGHEWVEVFFPNYGWVLVDPTLSEKNAIVIGQNLNYFAYFKAASVDDLTQLKCLSWSESCKELQMQVDFLPKIQFKENLLQDVDLFNSSNFPESDSINTFLYVKKIQAIFNYINQVFLKNKFPNISITSAYIVFFVIVYLIVYLFTLLIRKLISKLLKIYTVHKLKKLPLEGKRIVTTVVVTPPITTDVDIDD